MRFPAFPILLVAVCYLSVVNCYDIVVVKKPIPYSIHITKVFPRVPGAFQCGGPGEFRELRYSGCVDQDDESICKITTSEGITAEMDFIPIRTMSRLWLRIRTGIDGDHLAQVYEGPIPNSAVQRGSRYTISVTAPLDSKLKGSYLTGRYVIYDPDDWSIRVCMQADVQVI